jgi:hypothetical protein
MTNEQACAVLNRCEEECVFLDVPSRLNPSLTLRQAIKILRGSNYEDPRKPDRCGLAEKNLRKIAEECGVPVEERR